MVTANGTVAELSDMNCVIDGIHSSNSSSCRNLWTAVRGAGNSFGIVTSIKLRLHLRPPIKTALSIISINMTDVKLAATSIRRYLQILPEGPSITLYGLDAYFKAYSLVIKFASRSNKINALIYDLPSLFDDPNICHFLVEASMNVPYEKRINFLQQMNEAHSSYTNQEDQVMHTVKLRSWIASDDHWAVDNYNIVWGSGHSYSAASTIVNHDYVDHILVSTISQMKHELNQSLKSCSDCVGVIHRVGRTFRSIRQNKSVIGQGHPAINPRLSDAYLWVELDCTTFHRLRHQWPACSDFVDASQTLFDQSAPSITQCHYSNVPNLKSINWREAYYGKELYTYLQEVKREWDPLEVFSHFQSISSIVEDNTCSLLSASSAMCLQYDRVTNTTLANENKLIVNSIENCEYIYDRAAYKDLIYVSLSVYAVLISIIWFKWIR
jgi:hypothetical protein